MCGAKLRPHQQIYCSVQCKQADQREFARWMQRFNYYHRVKAYIEYEESLREQGMTR